MAQGALKAKAKARETPSNKKTFGSRVIKPKKGKAIKDILRKKSHSSQMTGSVEKALAHRAGHLELLAGGKKDSKDDGKAAGKAGKKGAK